MAKKQTFADKLKKRAHRHSPDETPALVVYPETNPLKGSIRFRQKMLIVPKGHMKDFAVE